jgi:hypothetical protein
LHGVHATQVVLLFIIFSSTLYLQGLMIDFLSFFPPLASRHDSVSPAAAATTCSISVFLTIFVVSVR